jgi:DNA-binding NtrC family response regulator/ligand-binding sensor domain-containing protein
MPLSLLVPAHLRSLSIPFQFRALLVVLALSTSPPMLSPASGQPLGQSVRGYVMKRWTTAEGLPHNSMLALLQTRDGYLWVGTTRGGLARFDGVTFRTFNVLNTPGLLSDWVAALHEEADGTLWIGTDAGLVRYRGGVFTPEPLGDEGLPDAITDIRADRDGRLWAAGRRRVMRRDGNRWTAITTDGGPVHPLSPAPDGTMWIATSRGLVEWRDGIVRTITTRDGLPGDVIFAVHEDRGGRVWIGTNGGLAHLDRRDARARVERTIWSDVPTSTLFEDRGGRLWIGAVGRLLVRSPDGTVSESIFGDEAESSETRVFTEDREGQIWLGIAGGIGGLHRLAPERVTTLAHQQGLPCDNVGAITEAADGTVWLSTLCADGRGVVSIRDGKVTSFEGPRYVDSLLAEPDGTVWAGTFAGQLFRLKDSRFLAVPSPIQRPDAAIAVIYRDGEGSLWLGTSHGLFRSRDDVWTELRTSDGPVSDDVRSIVSDRDGAMWIGTNAGISRYHEGRFTNYGPAEGLPPSPVRAIHVDDEGVVWIGTYGGGLARFKNGTFTAYGVRGGVLDTSVHRIFEPGDGFLWLTGDRGIRRVSKRDLHAIADGGNGSLDVTLYTEADGMRSVECNGMAQPAGWRLRDGTFLIPTQRGVVGINPATAQRAALPAPVPRIEETIIDGASSVLDSELVVEAGYRDVEIRYAAPALARPEQVQFRYQLEGYDAEWTEVGTRRVASFANLPPGGYRFLVAARNGDGPWSETPAAVALVLQPYFYQRLGFQFALFALTFCVTLGVGRWYILGLRRRAEHLERTVAERTAALSVAHERISVANQDLVTAKRVVEQAHGQVLAVLNQLDIGVLVLSDTGIVRYASAAAQRVLRKAEAVLVGQAWSACLPIVDADRAQVKARVERRSASEGRVPVQMVIGGTRYWMEIDVRDEPLPGDGRILYMYSATEVAALPVAGQPDGTHAFVGRSTAMHLVFKQIRDVARVDATVLIEGETGVGKELVARAIHRGSQRASKPFLAVNAAGLSESLLASQLFGHRRGAFTGAVDDQMGVFEAANGGTLFLDEVGDMPPSVQASLLRVLQEREITRLGDSQARRVDVRFLAATHRDLAREVGEGRFREDLLYRIRVATIAVPPLRERIDDVPLLVDTFLTQTPRAGRPAPQMGRDALEALMRYPWPGNVRELKAIIERALVQAVDDVIRLEDLPPEIFSGREPAREQERLPAGASERDRLIAALRMTGGNRKEAARLLGIGRTTLYRRLVEYGLDNNESGG